MASPADRESYQHIMGTPQSVSDHPARNFSDPGASGVDKLKMTMPSAKERMDAASSYGDDTKTPVSNNFDDNFKSDMWRLGY